MKDQFPTVTVDSTMVAPFELVEEAELLEPSILSVLPEGY